MNFRLIIFISGIGITIGIVKEGLIEPADHRYVRHLTHLSSNTIDQILIFNYLPISFINCHSLQCTDVSSLGLNLFQFITLDATVISCFLINQFCLYGSYI